MTLVPLSQQCEHLQGRHLCFPKVSSILCRVGDCIHSNVTTAQRNAGFCEQALCICDSVMRLVLPSPALYSDLGPLKKHREFK